MTPTLHHLSTPKGILRGITAPFVDREFARVTASGVVIEDVSAVGCGDCVKPNLPTGIKGQGTATDVLVRRAKMSKFAMKPVKGIYRNGDGIGNELGNARWSFIGCSSNENGDAGYDIKGPDNMVDKCDAAGNAHNFRFWSLIKVMSAWSRNPILVPGTPGLPVHFHICTAVEWKEQQVFDLRFIFARGGGLLLNVETKPGAIPPKILMGRYDIDGLDEIMRVIGPAPEIVWATGAPI